jgi:hypothetical protein
VVNNDFISPIPIACLTFCVSAIAVPEVSAEETFALFKSLVLANSTLAGHTRSARNGDVVIPSLPELSLPTITVAPPLRPPTQASLLSFEDNGPLSAKSRAGDAKRSGAGDSKRSGVTSKGAVVSSTGGHTRAASRTSVAGDTKDDTKRPVSRSSLVATKTSTTRPTTSSSTMDGSGSRSTTPRAPVAGQAAAAAVATTTSTPSMPTISINDATADLSVPTSSISSNYALAVAATSGPLPSRWFTPENVKQITDYVSQG